MLKENKRITNRMFKSVTHDAACMQDILDRLADYEDTKLTPDDINHLTAITADIPDLEALCNAWREGRCVVLPCKPGDDIYWIDEENKVRVHKNGVYGVSFTKNGFQIVDTDGCTDTPGTRYCYLTEQAATDALKETADE